MNKSVTPSLTANLLEQQIVAFTNFDRELPQGAAVKTLMKDVKSRDLWQVKVSELVIIEGLNPRTQDANYFAGIEALAQNMVKHGYMQDKPLSGYSTKLDGKDVIAVLDGHRRYAAVKRAIELGAPIKTVPLVLKERSDSMVDLTLSLLHANEGQPFTFYEKAVIAKRLKSYGWANKDIADEMGCTAAFVGELLTLAGAPQAIQELVKGGQMSGTLAVATIKTHGEKAASVAKESAAKAAAKGKGKTTAKDTSTADPKVGKARKLGYEFYVEVTHLFTEKKVMDVISREVYEALDALCTKVEAVKAPKAPKEKKVKAPKPPKAAKVKPIKVKKEPIAKKIAKASGKKAAAWDAAKANGADGEARAVATGHKRAYRRHSERA